MRLRLLISSIKSISMSWASADFKSAVLAHRSRSIFLRKTALAASLSRHQPERVLWPSLGRCLDQIRRRLPTAIPPGSPRLSFDSCLLFKSDARKKAAAAHPEKRNYCLPLLRSSSQGGRRYQRPAWRTGRQ